MEWTDDLTATWRHFGGDLTAMAAKRRDIVSANAASNADWGLANRIGLILRWVAEHDALPEVA